MTRVQPPKLAPSTLERLARVHAGLEAALQGGLVDNAVAARETCEVDTHTDPCRTGRYLQAGGPADRRWPPALAGAGLIAVVAAALLLDGSYLPGTFLSERKLGEQLGMSKTPIRAALDRLEAEDVGDRAVELRLFALEQVTAQRCGKPSGEPI